MAFAFDLETSVERVNPDRWGAHVAPHWNIGDKPNGGYLIALGLRAMQTQLASGEQGGSSSQPDPLTITAHFLRPGVPDAPASISTEVLKRGRSISTVRGSLAQEGKTRVEFMAGFGLLPAANVEGSGLDAIDQPAIDLSAPDLPPIDDSVDRAELLQGVGEMSLLSRVDVRVPPVHREFVVGSEARMTGWIRLSDGRPADSLSLPLFADAFPPSVFSKLGSVGWVPTLEMTVHVRRRPAPGWVAATFETDDLADGRFVETGALWDSTGQLVARSRQLGLLLT